LRIAEIEMRGNNNYMIKWLISLFTRPDIKSMQLEVVRLARENKTQAEIIDHLEIELRKARHTTFIVKNDLVRANNLLFHVSEIHYEGLYVDVKNHLKKTKHYDQ
jgi:hypothetical protein